MLRVVTLSVGNIRSVLRALDRMVTVPKEIVATTHPDVVRRADVLVVPGQGSFGAFAHAIRGGLDESIRDAIRAGKPYFGICLGLQVLFEASDEAPGERGLAVLAGHVHRLTPGTAPGSSHERALPHMGWNRSVALRADDPVLTSDHYYFAHSYAALAECDAAAAVTEYGDAKLASAIRKDNMVGVQFHPEKSQRAGLELIGRFFTSVVRPRS